MEQISNLKILYGIENNYRDITKKALIYHAKHNKSSNILHIPTNDNLRASMFGDHIFGVLKHIVIDNQIYDHNTEINIDITELLKNININDLIVKKSDWFDRTVTDPMKKLTMIHDNVMFKHGSLKEEFPEQVMAASFINKDNCVLELGANTGRNTIVIASILENDTNLVTLETDPNTCKMLEENRNINNFNFHIENSALSKRPLIQSGWCTIVSDELKAGHFRVNNITFEELEQKYNKKFDTLVADCEGALYYIFQDFPDMLKNINTVIMENDYWEISQKQQVDEILKQNGFSRVYSQAGGWGPCYNFFFETWKKL
jgi:FkbM family methyltransferase